MMRASDLHVSLIATLPPTQRQAILNELTDQEAEALIYDWRFWARPKQLPPEGDWFCWMLRSGRGFGKTWTGSNWVIEQARLYPQYPIALIGQTKADVRDTMVEVGESSILRQSPPWFMPKYEPSKRRIVWPNGAVAIIYSGDEPDQLRGPQHGKAWVDELAKFKYAKQTWDNLEFGLRLGPCPQVAVTTTPRPIAIIKALLADPDTRDTVGSTYENYHNLAPAYIKRVVKKYEGTTLGRQELHGAILDDMPGALWTRALLERTQVLRAPELVRIVVAIDPATTSGEESNDTGIIVAGLGIDGHGYVLEDPTMNDTPLAWARQAIAAYHKYKGDRIIGEANNGGDLVEANIRSVDADIPFKKVNASRGKRTRAEPVASLYEQGKVHHVGQFAELEDQLCSWVPGDDSPDRLDAAVWAITELMLGDDDTVSVGQAPDTLANYRGG